MVASDSPQAFGNILLYKDECVPWLKELADDVHEKGAAVMIQITHLGRRTLWSKLDIRPSPFTFRSRAQVPRGPPDQACPLRTSRGLGKSITRGPGHVSGPGRAAKARMVS